MATVPDSTPPALNVAPAGSEPFDIDHVRTPAPPDAASDTLNAEFAVIVLSDVVVIVGPSTTAIDSDRVEDRLAVSLATTVNVEVPSVVGVPLMTPAVDTERPAGSEPVTDHV